MKKLFIVLCILLIASAAQAVAPSDFDGEEWEFHWAGPGQPNEIGLGWGIEAGHYFVLIKKKGNNYVFFWETMDEDHSRYIILDVLVNGEWLSPAMYERQDDGEYLLVWPKK